MYNIFDSSRVWRSTDFIIAMQRNQFNSTNDATCGRWNGWYRWQFDLNPSTVQNGQHQIKSSVQCRTIANQKKTRWCLSVQDHWKPTSRSPINNQVKNHWKSKFHISKPIPATTKAWLTDATGKSLHVNLNISRNYYTVYFIITNHNPCLNKVKFTYWYRNPI